jgi:hypothetical protein
VEAWAKLAESLSQGGPLAVSIFFIIMLAYACRTLYQSHIETITKTTEAINSQTEAVRDSVTAREASIKSNDASRHVLEGVRDGLREIQIQLRMSGDRSKP